MKGGQRFTVSVSLPMVRSKAFAGMDLNHSGSPCTAGIGRGSTFSSAGGQRNVRVIGFVWSMSDVLGRRPIGHAPHYMQIRPVKEAAAGLSLSRGRGYVVV